MYVRESYTGPMPPFEHHGERPKKSLLEKIEYQQDKYMNRNLTIARATVAGGGILGLGYAYKNPDEALKLIKKHAPILEKPATSVYKFMKTNVERTDKHLNKFKEGNFGKKLFEEASKMKPEVQKEMGKAGTILKKIPGPAKALAVVVAGLYLLGGIHKADKIKQQYND